LYSTVPLHLADQLDPWLDHVVAVFKNKTPRGNIARCFSLSAFASCSVSARRCVPNGIVSEIEKFKSKVEYDPTFDLVAVPAVFVEGSDKQAKPTYV
jgi:hypothetical protein